ncbi:LysR family transcriptional regulator [Gluconacetobacter sacchari DSM 12717]|uniref:LysR family transcriptional regulator n=3 Tax=Gluconacetobacter sacchari TaxID=92759 RepID=A0A7W4I9I3_9PROT|nr:LysR family transcriptional regulator [Gluconacetobacter sacchari]GBQ29951.1 LysR family transcriptional regulator [Gluconacetobacter sacchari DSM 12717]
MDMRAIHAFRIVAESGSISAAAERLGTVQSALSARISQFEDALGAPLFERLPRGVRLTAAGTRLLPFAGRIEALVAEAVATARGDDRPWSGPFRLGAIAIVAASILPDGVARFLAAHGGVDLRLVTGVSRQLVAEVERGALDAAIVAEGFGAPALPSMPLRRMPLALFRPGDRPPERLGQAFAFGEGCVCRARLDAILRRKSWRARIVELGSVEAILGCVEAGIGMTLLPHLLGGGRAVVTEPCGSLALTLVCRSDTAPMARAFGAMMNGRKPLDPMMA